MRHCFLIFTSMSLDFWSFVETALEQPPVCAPAVLPYPHVAAGKVRDVYDLGDRYLILASDRVSAFDVVLPTGIAGKGVILTQLSLWWFEQTGALLDNHIVDNHAEALAEVLADFPELLPRAMLVRKLRPLRLEAVVRGYLSGSGWKTYQATGSLWEHALPKGLLESEQLPRPVFTPTTKAELGGKDVPVTAQQARQIIGEDRFGQVQALSMQLFATGSERAAHAGLILADTKFEFGTDAAGKLYLIDEVLTPDSSRYWPRETYQPGRPQEAFDKQFVRDYLESLDWDKSDPGPALAPDITAKTQQKYMEALRLLTAAPVSTAP
jgi:phosphoribosylaminoimidazole-succinocarboxamide synthase